MKRIGLIGGATSNLGSVSHAIHYLGYEPIVIEQAQEIKNCSHLILPGVGSFQSGMQHLMNQNLLSSLLAAYQQGKPILGICLGMQLFAQESAEFGQHVGLKLLPHVVEKVDCQDQQAKLPHVGWSEITQSELCEKSSLFKGIPQHSPFYFTHSYAYAPCSKDYVTSTVKYFDYEIIASVEKDNLFGVQFHPEKSQIYGLQLINNFINIC